MYVFLSEITGVFKGEWGAYLPLNVEYLPGPTSFRSILFEWYNGDLMAATLSILKCPLVLQLVQLVPSC